MAFCLRNIMAGAGSIFRPCVSVLPVRGQSKASDLRGQQLRIYAAVNKKSSAVPSSAHSSLASMRRRAYNRGQNIVFGGL